MEGELCQKYYNSTKFHKVNFFHVVISFCKSKIHQPTGTFTLCPVIY